MMLRTLTHGKRLLVRVRRQATAHGISAASCMSKGLAASMAIAASRRLQVGRRAISELGLEETKAALGGEGRAKALWKMFREGRNPFDTDASAGGLGHAAREALYSLDPAHVLAMALQPRAVEMSMDLLPQSRQSSPRARRTFPEHFSSFEDEVRQKLGEGCGTRKFLLRLHDGNAVECVLIPQVEGGISECRQLPVGRAKRSTTLCVSAQVGCAQGCKFCRTASMGIVRNLEPDEIFAQVVQGRRIARELGMPGVTNVVFMGMGEPLANLQGVMPVVQALLDSYRMQVGASKVVVSTVGPSPAQVRALGALRCRLAWSLHSVDPDLRKRLVKSARFAPEELRDAFFEALQSPYRSNIEKRLTVAVVLLRDINDSESHAQEIAHFLEPLAQKGVLLMVDLIPYNEAGIPGFQRPTLEAVHAFRDAAYRALPTLLIHIRHPRGENEFAACGQLATAVRGTKQQAMPY